MFSCDIGPVSRVGNCTVRRGLCALALGLLTVLAAGPAPAVAAPLTIAPVTADVPISAQGGWVVWSVPVPRGWGLNAWHAGVVTSLPVAPRPDPFDVDLGTDEKRRVVAMFSRCSKNPTNTPFPVHIAPWTGDDCGINVVDLATGEERRSGVPRPEGSSYTTPSMWRGRIAFGRRDPFFGDVQQVELWTPPSDTTTTLRHGAIPTACPFRRGCEGVVRRGAVQSLDLNARIVTFLWWIEAPAVRGHGGWEVRVDRLSDGRSFLAGSGFVGEACPDGPDLLVPSSPAADGNDVWYAQLSSSCYVDASSVVHFRTRRRGGIGGRVPGEIVQFAKDRTGLYALVAPKPARGARPTCSAPGAPCMLERIDPPARFRRLTRPRSPFF